MFASPPTSLAKNSNADNDSATPSLRCFLRELAAALNSTLAADGHPTESVLSRLKTTKQLAAEWGCSTRTVRRKAEKAGGRKIDGRRWVFRGEHMTTPDRDSEAQLRALTRRLFGKDRGQDVDLGQPVDRPHHVVASEGGNPTPPVQFSWNDYVRQLCRDMFSPETAATDPVKIAANP